jgi:hypothetical protein
VSATRNVRNVIINADSLLRLFIDYCGGDIPQDAKLVQMLVKPTERGKFAFVVESDEIPANAAPLQVHFDIRRIFTV